MDIEIRDFQIIERMRLDVTGITALIGDTNNGKTSVVRALETAIYNLPGATYLRYGSKKARIVMSFEGSSPVLVAWEKTEKGGARYLVNGVEYRKTGKTQLPEVAELGLSEVELGKEKFRVQFWRQLEEPFLIFRSSQQVFEILSSVQRAEKQIIPVLHKMAADERDLRVSAVSLEGEIKALEGSLTARRESVSCMADRRDRVAPVIADLRTKREEVRASETLAKSLQDREQELDVTRGRIRDGASVVSSVEKCVLKAASMWEQVQMASNLHRGMEEASVRIEEIQKLIAASCRVDEVLTEIKQHEPVFAEIAGAERVLGEMTSAASGVMAVKRSRSQVEARIRELEQKLATFPTCPLCGRDR